MHGLKDTYNSGYDEALEMGLPMGPEHLILEEGPTIDRLREHTGNDRLFFYYHQFEKVYVLGAWVYTEEESPNGTAICIEIDIFHFHPERKRVPIQLLAAKCIPVDKAYKAEVRRRQLLKTQLKNDSVEAQKYRAHIASILRRQGDEIGALNIERGITSIAAPNEVDADTWNENEEHLKAIAKVAGSSIKRRGAIQRGESI